MSKNNIIILVAGVLVVLGVGLYVKKIEQNKDYSVVYLSTGEVYVGKLSVFRSFKLENAYILQIAKDEKDPTKSNFQLNPISEALWAPKRMHLIKDNVVFYGPLLPTSKIAQTLAEQAK